MNDFLEGLVNRMVSNAGTVKPRQPYRFELNSPQRDERSPSTTTPVWRSGGSLMRATMLPETQGANESDSDSHTPLASWKSSHPGQHRGQLQALEPVGWPDPSYRAPEQARSVQVNDPRAGAGTPSESAYRGESINVESAQEPEIAAHDRVRSASRVRIEASPDYQQVIPHRSGVSVPPSPVLPSADPGLSPRLVSSPVQFEPSSARQVVVRIGRLEVKAVRPAEKQRSKRRERAIQPMDLDEYARRRNKDQSP